MAFKFKTKKRPSLGQAIAGGFAQGVSAGLQRGAELSLQDRLKKQEEEKNRLKKELDLFNGMVSDVELTQANRETIMRGKRMIIASDGKTGASTVYSAVSPDFQFMPSKEEKAQIESDKVNLNKDIELADKIVQSQMPLTVTDDQDNVTMDLGTMSGLSAPKAEIDRRKDESDIQRGTKKDPTKTSSGSGRVTYSALQKTIEDYQDLLNARRRAIKGLDPLTEEQRKEYNAKIDSLRRQQDFLRTGVGNLQSTSAESTKTNIPGF